MIAVPFLLTAFPIHAFVSHNFSSSWHPSGVPHITTSEKFLISLHLQKWSQKKISRKTKLLFVFFFLLGSDSNSRLGSDIWGCDTKITDSVSVSDKLAEQAK